MTDKTHSFISPLNQSVGNNIDGEPAIKKRLLIHEASRWIGIDEHGGNNRGQMVERFQAAVDKKAQGEPWCMAFVQFCVAEVDSLYVECFSHGTQSSLYRSEHVLTTFNQSKALQIAEPEPGAIVCWQMFDGNNPTSSGHAGIITAVLGRDRIVTIEGNTRTDGQGINREGDAVCRKERMITSSGPMRIKGFLRAW